jgi:hypothetical protein
MSQKMTTFYALRNDKYNLEYIKYTTNFKNVKLDLDVLKRINYAKYPLDRYGGVQEWNIEYIKAELSDKYNTPLIIQELKKKRESVSISEYTKKLKQKEKADERQSYKEKRDRQRKESEEFRKKCLSDKSERELHSYNPQSYYLLGDGSSTHHPTEQTT